MNVIDVADVLFEAGFRSQKLVTALAVIGGETAGTYDELIVHVNEGGTKPGSRDRGLWAINDAWHPDVSDEQAFDPAWASNWAYEKSSGGENFNLWNAYKNRVHEKYLPLARCAHDAARRLRVCSEETGLLKDGIGKLQDDLADAISLSAMRKAQLDEAVQTFSTVEIERDKLQEQMSRFDKWVDDIKEGS